MDFFDAGELRGQRAEDGGSGGCEKQTETGTDKCKEKCLREELRDERAARRAQRKAYGDFVLALSGTRQEQSDDIRTRDEQKKRDGAEEQPEGAARIGDDGLLERFYSHGEVGIGFGELAAELRLHSGEIGTSLCNGDAVLEASDDGEPIVLPGLAVRETSRNRAP